MFELKSRRYFGLDISESAVKLVEIYKTREGYRLGKAHLIELDIDPLFDDSEKRNEAVQAALAQLKKEERIENGNVALSISSQSVFVRPLRIPKIAKNKIEQIIHYEAQLQVPFPINEVIWNYEIFDVFDSPELEVALVAVKKDIVEEKMHLVSDLGLEVDFVEMDAFSLFNIMDYVDAAKNRIIIDIGGKITDIIIAEEKKIWTRSVLIGGNDFTKAIASEFKIGFKEAEKLKRQEGVVAITEKDKETSVHAAAISDAISPILVELLTNVSKSIGYYKSQFGTTKVFKEILITGGGSRIRNLSQFVRSNIDIPTRSFNLFDKIKNDVDFEVRHELMHRMDTAIGLALRTVMPLATTTNLMSKEVLKAKEFQKKRWYIFGSLVTAIFIFMTLTGFVNMYNRKKYADLAKTTAMMERYAKRRKRISILQNEIRDLTKRLDHIAGIAESRRRALEIYTELMRALPENLWITQIQQDDEILTLQGRTRGTFANINEFKNRLKDSEYFKSVTILSANVLKEKDAAGDIRVFTIEIELDIPRWGNASTT